MIKLTKLNQLLAVEKGVKQTALKAVTDAYHNLGKGELLSGITRRYRPKDDDGDQLPGESKRVQLTVRDALADVRNPLARLLDVTASKDQTNTQAFADVVVNGETILLGLPVSTLLFLEKQLTDLHTLIAKLPRLDPAENWTWDPNVGAYATEPVETHRSQKIPKAHVLYQATDKHPAQVQAYSEDIVVGYWETVKFSGAIPADEADQLLHNVNRLRDAVKQAREEANVAEVFDVRIGENVLAFILDN